MALHIVLVEPEIPQNTGNIARTCAATNCVLHLVKPLGFDISEKAVKRAGLDYWDSVKIEVHENVEDLFSKYYRGDNFYFFSTKAKSCYTEAKYKDGDFLFFGRETRGLPEPLLEKYYDKTVRIPMFSNLRSLNLSNSVAIAVYEALRQNDFNNLTIEGELTGRGY